MPVTLSSAGSRKRQATPSRVTKPFWKNFERQEMGLLAAFVHSYQKIVFTRKHLETSPLGKKTETVSEVFTPAFVNNLSREKRPWAPIERLHLALAEFAKKKIKFRVAFFHTATNEVHSEASLPPDSTEGSREIYEAILNWNEKVLKDMVAQYGASLEKLGFRKNEPGDFAPMTMEGIAGYTEISNILRRTETEPGTTTANEPPARAQRTLREAVLEALGTDKLTQDELLQKMLEEDPKLNKKSFVSAVYNLTAEKFLERDKETKILAVAAR